MSLINCPHCGKRHRTDDKVLQCKVDQEFLAELQGRLPKALPRGSTTGWEQYSEIFIKSWWGNITYYIRKRDKERCQSCGAVEKPWIWGKNWAVKDEGVSLEIHHIIPRARGGSSHPTNLITLCHKCHVKTFHLSHSKLVQMTNKARKDEGQKKIADFK